MRLVALAPIDAGRVSEGDIRSGDTFDADEAAAKPLVDAGEARPVDTDKPKAKSK